MKNNKPNKQSQPFVQAQQVQTQQVQTQDLTVEQFVYSEQGEAEILSALKEQTEILKESNRLLVPLSFRNRPMQKATTTKETPMPSLPSASLFSNRPMQEATSTKETPIPSLPSASLFSNRPMQEATSTKETPMPSLPSASLFSNRPMQEATTTKETSAQVPLSEQKRTENELQKREAGNAEKITSAIEKSNPEKNSFWQKALSTPKLDEDAKDKIGHSTLGSTYAAFKEVQDFQQGVSDFGSYFQKEKGAEKNTSSTQEAKAPHDLQQDINGRWREKTGKFASLEKLATLNLKNSPTKKEALTKEKTKPLSEDLIEELEKQAEQKDKQHDELIEAIKKKGGTKQSNSLSSFAGIFAGIVSLFEQKMTDFFQNILAKLNPFNNGKDTTKKRHKKKKIQSGNLEKPTKEASQQLSKKATNKIGTKAAIQGGGRILARSLPIVGTIAMTGIDAVEGFSNEEMHKKAFRLKEGEEASTGQKLASSLANVADMGGILTGGLSMVGVNTNTANWARAIHDTLDFSEDEEFMPSQKKQRESTKGKLDENIILHQGKQKEFASNKLVEKTIETQKNKQVVQFPKEEVKKTNRLLQTLIQEQKKLQPPKPKIEIPMRLSDPLEYQRQLE